MKKDNSEILNKIGRAEGFSVPEGYFEDFAKKMIDTLPDRPDLERPDTIVRPRTLWHRLRPYTYMAAMFAGVWCMLKMFTIMSGASDDRSIFDSHPSLADAMGNETFVNEYVVDGVNQWELYDDLYSDGIDLDSLSITLFDDSIYAPEITDEDHAYDRDNLPAHI